VSVAKKKSLTMLSSNVQSSLPMSNPPYVLHGLTALDNETIDWLLNTCPEIYSAAKQ